MNRDDIIRWAHEAGAYEPTNKDDWAFELVDLERFANFVAAAERGKCGECGKASAEGWALYCVKCCEDSMVAAAVAEEREACIEDCEALGDSWRQGYLDGVKSCIAVIRARGQNEPR